MKESDGPLRRGWTTGACATAAAKAAYNALIFGAFPDPVEILLPGGQRPSFPLARAERHGDAATVGIVKDAGDDPDVTHGALILATVLPGKPGSGIVFRAGDGVGMVTRPGLQIPPGEPAINPVPRQMMRQAISEIAGGAVPDIEIEIGVENGAALALKTLNARLGIVGGLSILGTTGIVIPYSCAAWIHAIQRGVDVARAAGLDHVAGATGRGSEQAAAKFHALPETALIDMGDFVGGMLKYLRAHPVAKVTVAGGLAKIAKLGQGRLDLHSKRGEIDRAALADLAAKSGAPPESCRRIATTATGAEAFALAEAEGIDLGQAVATQAWEVAAAVLAGSGSQLDILLFDRLGRLRGHKDFAQVPERATAP